MRRLILSTIIICLLVSTLHSQITTNEQPIGLSLVQQLNASQRDGRQVQKLEQPNMIAVHSEDAINDTGLAPHRFAHPIPVNFTLTNSGEWHTLPNGDKLWQLRVHVPGALSLHAYYDKFYLPEGSKFFVYSEETGQSIGAITSEFLSGSFNEPMKFATGLIFGETIVFEYWQPASVQGTALISISRIDYGYRDVINPFMVTPRAIGSSADCNVNINCWEGINWQSHKRAVMMIITPSGTCTGALINNTSNDFTPYVLTAHHCLCEFDAIDNPNASQWMFRWGFERSGCSNDSPIHWWHTTVGAIVVANNSNTDFALLRLTQSPLSLPNYIPYFLGWSRSTDAPATAVGIHHPRGDVKKISRSTNITNQFLPTPWIDPFGVLPGNRYWRLTWNEFGVTEGGSSGSPLINSAGQVVGQLRGGMSACDQLINMADWYGRFDKSWDGNGTSEPRRRLRDWLDPRGTDPTTLAPLRTTIAGTNTLCNSSQFQIQNIPPNATVTWQAVSNFILLSSTTGNSVVATMVNPNAMTFVANAITATITGPGIGVPIVATKDLVIGRPNANWISSRYKGHQKYVGQQFDEVIYYNQTYPGRGNAAGINRVDWRQISQHPPFEIDFLGMLPTPVPGFVYGTHRTLAVNHFNADNQARVQVRMHNQCGWSDWATLTYSAPPPPPVCNVCLQMPCVCFHPCCPLGSRCWRCCPNCSRGIPPFCCLIPSNLLFIVYPNPARDVLTVRLNDEQMEMQAGGQRASLGNVELRLYNHDGQLVRRQAMGVAAQQAAINISGLPAGNYVLNIVADGEMIERQVIVVVN